MKFHTVAFNYRKNRHSQGRSYGGEHPSQAGGGAEHHYVGELGKVADVENGRDEAKTSRDARDTLRYQVKRAGAVLEYKNRRRNTRSDEAGDALAKENVVLDLSDHAYVDAISALNVFDAAATP